jgi:hypothetical protein
MAGTDKILSWISGLSAAATVGLAIWTASLKSDIDKRDQELKQMQLTSDAAFKTSELAIKELQHQADESLRKSELAIKEAQQTIGKYEFIHRILPGLLDAKREQKLLTVNLVKLVLPPSDAQRLFDGLPETEGPAVAEIRQLANQISEEASRSTGNRINTLSRGLNDPGYDRRQEAYANLISEYKRDPRAIASVVDLFSENLFDTMTDSGRINALRFLLVSDIDAWTSESTTAAGKALALIETRNKEGKIRMGDQTRQLLADLRTKLRL